MHNLYPVEVLSLPLRAKGMALYALVQAMAGVVQQHGSSVGIGKLGYKIWVIYIIYNSSQLVIAYYIFPETGKMSLEDIDYIFETPNENPVKLSLKLKRLEKKGKGKRGVIDGSRRYGRLLERDAHLELEADH